MFCGLPRPKGTTTMTRHVASGAAGAERWRYPSPTFNFPRRTDQFRPIRLVTAVLLRTVATAAVIALVTAGLLWNTLFAQMPHMPSQEALWALNRESAVEFVDTNGATIAVRGPRYGRAVSAADLPAHVVNAFIAAEDRRFRDHTGVDYSAISRALLENVRAGHIVQGGSTITQQLVKNLSLNQDQTIKRKAQEARLAVDLETVLSKDEILDLYLNRIYLGAGAYGLDAAAQTYFGKTPSDLTLGEAAMLASFPKAPSRSARRIGEASTIERQHYVLDQMVRAGFVTPAEAVVARNEHLVFAELQSNIFSGHVLDYAVERIHELLPNPPPDLVIRLTIDLELQARTQQAVENGIARMPAMEGAAILMENTGAIRAMVGGRDYSMSQFNRAAQARRQPGSSFKMFVYAAALEDGMTPETVRFDEPVSIGNWRPANYSEEYLGPVTLAEALSQSLNSVAVQIGFEVGPGKVVALAHRFGVTSRLHAYPSIALGTDEVTLLDMTTGYGVLARGELQMAPYIIEEIRNSRGDLLYSNPVVEPLRIYPRQLAEDMTGMLNRVVVQGTGSGAQVALWDVAGKTGTSQGWRDAWFIGYTTRFVGGVWAGNDNDTPTAKVTGGAIPARIFSEMMTAALEGIAPEALPGAEPEDPLPELAVETDRESSVSSNGLAAISPPETAEGDSPVLPVLPEAPAAATAGLLGQIFD
jgi:penicillin-binding protein 1A